MRVAVIGLSVLVSRDRYRHFVRDRRDRQLARLRFFDDVVTRGIELVFRELRVFRVRVERGRIFADKRSRRTSGNSLECQTFNRAVIAGNALLLSIISLRGALRRQRDFGGGDRQTTIVHNKLDVREVVARVLEVRNFQPHRVSARVGLRHGIRTVEPEVGCLVLPVADSHVVARHGLLASVILLGSRVARDRYRHFVRDRRDRQLAQFLRDIVVVRVRAFFQRVSERVLARANNRLASRHVVRRALTFNKAVAANRHIVVRQRGAVVLLAVSSGGQRHAALIDLQRSRIRLRNDIFLRRVNLANGILREVRDIRSSIRSRRARFGNTFKGNAFRRTGKAGNALRRSIISRRLALRRQRDVLIIVEIDFVRSLGDRDRLHCLRFRRNCVAVNIVVGYKHGIAEIRIVCCGGLNLFRCSVQIIVYRVSVLFIVERQRSFLICKRNFLYLLLRITFYIITEGIEAIFQGIRSLNPNFFSLVHFTCYSFSSTDFRVVIHIDVSNDIG